MLFPSSHSAETRRERYQLRTIAFANPSILPHIGGRSLHVESVALSGPCASQQLRSQAQEIGKLQSKVEELTVEKRDLMKQLERPPKEQLVDSIVRSFSSSEMLRLESVEEKVHCNTYKSHTDARFRVFGAPGRFRGSFPDIHQAKVEVSTPESFGQAVKAQLEFKPLQPLHATALRIALDVGDLLSISGAPTLVVTPSPPFLINSNTQWNPQLEMNGITDEGTHWEARYTVHNDGAVVGSLEGELRRSHDVYGDFAISRWMHEDDIDAWNKYSRHAGQFRGDHDNNPFGNPNDPSTPFRDGRSSRGGISPRRSLWGRNSPHGWNDGWSPRSSGRNSPAGSMRGGGSPRGGSPRNSPGGNGSVRGSSRGGRRGLGWNPTKGPPKPRWLATWLRSFEGYELSAKIGDAVAVANSEPALGSGGGMSINGGVINTEPGGWVTSPTWEAEVAAKTQIQHNLDGRVCARFMARELEFGASYHFTEEFKGWHVNAKAVLSPQGIATPEFTLHHVWDF